MLREPSFFSSLACAASGLKEMVRTERNFRIHLIATCFAIIFGFELKISRLEWLFIFIAVATVLILETLNAVVERMIDLVKPRLHPIVHDIKDMMAGAVLLAATASVVVGGVIFLPRIITVLVTYGIMYDII
ncbi:MAG: diacylglycerol kinase family protein [bacterium]